ncbi:hypothetical protein [Paramuribaculum intestinale]|uniref:hypothetical protein n=1 Tax=Paramuribaculum intestinale TaxID=2094151 RepID=UPI0025B56524|nr:hypothetical protein [Paramuribaculum intestinale]
MEYLPEIISALAVIITAWFSYNQYAKNKLTDLKVEQMQRDNEVKRKRRSDNSALVHGELWEILHELKADRVYIVQPHPLGNESMVSIYFESKRKGVESMKPRIQNLKMCDVAKFCADLTKNLFMFITDIDNQVTDLYAKSLLSSCGTEQVIIKRLSDNSHDWVGSIFCEFTHGQKIDEAEARAILHEAAMNIQYILPAFID